MPSGTPGRLHLTPRDDPPLPSVTPPASAALVPALTRPYVVTSSGREALARILAYLRLRPRDEIWISTTLGDRDLYVSPCVTATVARYCRFAFQSGPQTVAALVIHDYGVPHPDMSAIQDRCRRHGWPLIEDAAHAFASTDPAGKRMGEGADFALFSLPKFFAWAHGGLVMGLPRSAAGDAPAVATRLRSVLPWTGAIAQVRRQHWQMLDELLGRQGRSTALPLTPSSVPSLYVLRTRQQFALLRRLRAAGIESGPDVHCDRLLLPCHQGLRPQDLQCIADAVQ